MASEQWLGGLSKDIKAWWGWNWNQALMGVIRVTIRIKTVPLMNIFQKFIIKKDSSLYFSTKRRIKEIQELDQEGLYKYSIMPLRWNILDSLKRRDKSISSFFFFWGGEKREFREITNVGKWSKLQRNISWFFWNWSKHSYNWKSRLWCFYQYEVADQYTCFLRISVAACYCMRKGGCTTTLPLVVS